MMKTILMALSVALLAGCGGGGSGSGTIGGPPPGPTYHMRVTFTGGAMLHASGAGRHILARRTQQDISPSNPVVLSTTPANSTGELAFSGFGYDTGVATVAVTPQPPTSPVVALNSTGITLAIAPVATANTLASSFTVGTQSQVPTSGSLGAVVSALGLSENIPVIVVRRSLIACGDRLVPGREGGSYANDQIGAVAFSGGLANTVSQSAADMYFDGPNCSQVGTVSAGEAEATLHFPFGAVLESSAVNSFATVPASLWSNTITSLPFSQLLSDIQAATNPPDEILVKTSTGAIEKVGITDLGTNGNLNIINFNYDVAT